MDIIFITDLRVDTSIGIYDWERTQQQTDSLDSEMATEISAPAAGSVSPSTRSKARTVAWQMGRV